MQSPKGQTKIVEGTQATKIWQAADKISTSDCK